MNILMVCMGNICRSPMAEGIARHLVHQAGRSDIYIDSAGTHTYHVGEPPDKRAQAEMRHHSIDISHLRARALTLDDFVRFDVIMAADSRNVEALSVFAPDQQARQKIIKMCDGGYGGYEDVIDPYYGGREDFQRVYTQLYTSLNSYLKCL